MNWLLLRGLAREARHWGDFPAVLEQAITPGQVLALDLPGAGERYLETSPLSVAGIAEMVRAEFLQRRSPGPWGIVGMSLGGMVAMEWAHRHPADFERMVLINTSARGTGHPHQRMRPWAAGQLARIARAPDPETKERLVLEMTARDSREWVARFAAYSQERPISMATALRQLAAAVSYTPPREAPCPVRLLTGARDRMVAPACSRALAKRWRAELVEHPTATHDLALDEPAWTAEQISSFGLR